MIYICVLIYRKMDAKSWPLNSNEKKQLRGKILSNAEVSGIYGGGEVSMPHCDSNVDETVDSPPDLVALKNEIYKLIRRFHGSKENGLLLDKMLFEDPKLESIIDIVSKVEQQMAVESAEDYEASL